MDGFAKDRRLLHGLCAYADITSAALARAAGLAATTVNRSYNGTSPSRLSQPTLEKLRARFPDYPGWADFLNLPKLADTQHPYRHEGEPQRPAAPPDRPRDQLSHDESMAIPMLELAYGMGGTFLDSFDQPERLEHFPRSFIRMFTSAPAGQLACTYGIGDSMEPTIGDRDPILFDRSRQFIRVSDQIWVLSVGGIGMVKRVRFEAGKTLLISDNARVPDYIVGDEELHIIGRVIAVVRRL